MNWETFNSTRLNKVATLNGSTKQPNLTFNGSLRKEFTEGDRVELLYDKESNSIGLQKGETGYKVVFAGGQLCIRMLAFCRHYELHKSYIVKEFSKDGDILVLPLTERDV